MQLVLPTTKHLGKTDWHCIHQVGAAGFNQLPYFTGFTVYLLKQLLQCRQQLLL